MDLTEFRNSISSNTPPGDASLALQALWWDAKGDWEKAHEAAQQRDDADGCWVHAYLHRKEGDPGNAAYWYRRAGRATPDMSLDEEWAQIASSLI